MACKNRNQHVNISVESAIRCSSIFQLIIVDWSSDEPIKQTLQKGIDDSRIVIIRVDNEEHWSLSRAYNLAASFVKTRFILKLDCDVVVNSCSIIDEYASSCNDNQYFSGDWKLARNQNEQHLNGVLFVQAQHWRAINGFDERISLYGWEDTDIHRRFSSINLEKESIHPDNFCHQEHGDNMRSQDKIALPHVIRTQYNRIMSEKLPFWNNASQNSLYKTEVVQPNYYKCSATKRVKNYEEHFNDVELEGKILLKIRYIRSNTTQQCKQKRSVQYYMTVFMSPGMYWPIYALMNYTSYFE